MAPETLSVRADIACVITHTYVQLYRYDRAEVVLTLFRSIRFQSYAVESQIQTANKGIGNVSCKVVVSSFELNQRVLLPHLGIRTCPLVHQATKTAFRYLASRSLA
jgi:hypothetical protein